MGVYVLLGQLTVGREILIKKINGNSQKSLALAAMQYADMNETSATLVAELV